MRPWLVALALLARAVSSEDAEGGPAVHRIEVAGLAGSLDLPARWAPDIALDGSADAFPDPVARRQLIELRRLPNDEFEHEERWCNTGEILARLRLRLVRKEFKGTARDLADRCIEEIRAKWPAFKGAKPVVKPVTLRTGPAIYVSLERKDEPPYRVHFVVMTVGGKGCGLFCYGSGPVVNVVNKSGRDLPDAVRKTVESAQRLPPEKLKAQAALFREFETVIAPSLRLAEAAPAEPPAPDPSR